MVSGLSWYVAYRLKLRYAFLTGVLLPVMLAGITLGTGAVLRALQVNPVHGVDAWLGWGIVAVGFYPAATVWYLSSQLKVRLTVFGTVLLMFAGMFVFSWTSRERWRYEFWDNAIYQEVVALLEVPGFRMTRGMNVVTTADTSPVFAYVGYLLEGEGAHRGQSLYVESDLGPGFEPMPGHPKAEKVYERGLDPKTCELSRLVRPSGGKDFCATRPGFDLVMLYKGVGFQIFWRGSVGNATTLRALAEASTIRWRPKGELRYIPLGPAGWSVRPGLDAVRG